MSVGRFIFLMPKSAGMDFCGPSVVSPITGGCLAIDLSSPDVNAYVCTFLTAGSGVDKQIQVVHFNQSSCSTLFGER